MRMEAILGCVAAILVSCGSDTAAKKAPTATRSDGGSTMAVTVVTEAPSADPVEATSSLPTSMMPVEVVLRLDGIGPYAFGQPQRLVEATLTQALGKPVIVDGAPVFSCLRWGCSDLALLSWPIAGLFVAFSDRTDDGVALPEPVLTAWTITAADAWWPGKVHVPDPTSSNVVFPPVSISLENGVQLGSTFDEVRSAFPTVVGAAWGASTFVPTGFFVSGADATNVTDGSLDWNVVAGLQSALVDDGALIGVDGIAGPATMTAFAAYRERTGLSPQAAFAELGVQPPPDAKVVRLSVGPWFWELECGALEPFGVPSGC